MPATRNCSDTQPTIGAEIAHQPGTAWPAPGASATRPAAIFTPQPPTMLTCEPVGMVLRIVPAGLSRTLRLVISGLAITTVAVPPGSPQVLVVAVPPGAGAGGVPAAAATRVPFQAFCPGKGMFASRAQPPLKLLPSAESSNLAMPVCPLSIHWAMSWRPTTTPLTN